MNRGAINIEDSGEKLEIQYEDLDVETFGGSDCEAIYTLNQENRQKLFTLLSEDHCGSLREMIIDHFGSYLEKESLITFLQRHSIEYTLFTWIS